MQPKDARCIACQSCVSTFGWSNGDCSCDLQSFHLRIPAPGRNDCPRTARPNIFRTHSDTIPPYNPDRGTPGLKNVSRISGSSSTSPGNPRPFVHLVLSRGPPLPSIASSFRTSSSFVSGFAWAAAAAASLYDEKACALSVRSGPAFSRPSAWGRAAARAVLIIVVRELLRRMWEVR